MRIAYILPSLANKGPVIVVKELVAGLVVAGHDCIVFYFDNIVELEMDCTVRKIKLWDKIDFNDFDIIHTHMFRPDLYVRMHRSKNNSSLFVSTLHNPINYSQLKLSMSNLKALILHVLWNQSLKTFDKIVVLNKETKKDIEKNISNINVRIIFNGRNIATNHRISNEEDRFILEGIKEKYILIGTTSSIDKRKNLSQVVQSLVYLPGYAFVVVGDGPERLELQKLARQLMVSDRCIFLGYRQDAVKYQSYFDIFIMSSLSEGFPLALIEAAAYAKPTALSNISILTSIISSKEVVFFQIGNVNSLVQSITYLFENKESYSYSIREYYEKYLSRDNMIENHLILYHNKL